MIVIACCLVDLIEELDVFFAVWYSRHKTDHSLDWRSRRLGNGCLVSRGAMNSGYAIGAILLEPHTTPVSAIDADHRHTYSQNLRVTRRSIYCTNINSSGSLFENGV
jgi:hypothetical protein